MFIGLVIATCKEPGTAVIAYVSLPRPPHTPGKLIYLVIYRL
jgi:hypothetical protein